MEQEINEILNEIVKPENHDKHSTSFAILCKKTDDDARAEIGRISSKDALKYKEKLQNAGFYFVCSGVDYASEKECNALVSPSHGKTNDKGEKGRTFFKLISKKYEHIEGCCCRRSNEIQLSSKDIFLKTIYSPKYFLECKILKKVEPYASIISEEKKQIKGLSVSYNLNLADYYYQTRHCHFEDQVPGEEKTFGDVLYNAETCINFKNHIEKFNDVILVIGERLLKFKDILEPIRNNCPEIVSENFIILKDPFNYGNDAQNKTKRFYFYLTFPSKTLREYVLNNIFLAYTKEQTTMFLVLCNWAVHKCEDFYIIHGEIESKKQIFPIANSFFELFEKSFFLQ